MNLDAELMALDDLPDDARAAVDEAERAVAAVRADAENRAAANIPKNCGSRTIPCPSGVHCAFQLRLNYSPRYQD